MKFHTVRQHLICTLGLSVLTVAMMIDQAHAGEAENDSTPNWKEETLTGDWNGMRTSFYKSGVEMGLVHKTDVFSNTSGGIKRGTAWLGQTEATLDLDFEKLLGWNSTTAHVAYYSDLGSKFNQHYVGAFIGVDNIEAGTNTAQFYNAWVEKSFLNDSLSLKGGLYSIDSEFYTTETSSEFLSPPFGSMANDIGQTDTPSISPFGALGLRVKYTSPNKSFYMQGAVTDGVAGDPNHPRGTHIRLGHGEGTLSIVEFGLTPQAEASSSEPDVQANKEESEIFNKTAIGFWRYSRKFDDVIDTDSLGNPKRRHSQGAYFLAERTLMVEQGHASQGLSGFMRFGTASESVNQAVWTTSLGLRYHGLISGRDDDIAGVAVTVNHNGDKFRRANGGESTETDLELNYRAKINGWFILQPNVQYIINPGMDTSLKNAFVVGLHAEVNF